MKQQPLSESMIASTEATDLMDFGRALFRYEPYPIGVIENVFEPFRYNKLVETFPTVEMFRFMQNHGDKWSLSELNNVERYHEFLRKNEEWRQVYDYVKSRRFIAQVLDVLAQAKIDLGLRVGKGSAAAECVRAKLAKLLGLKSGSLRARFEFSMMSAAGGHILPHTDSPQKHITLVVAILGSDEWNSDWGGGTDLMRPLDPSDNFNFFNRYLKFDQVETIGTMAYEPNQCVIFIKTFNSLHAVRPMTGPKSTMRRTLTINIESD